MSHICHIDNIFHIFGMTSWESVLATGSQFIFFLSSSFFSGIQDTGFFFSHFLSATSSFCLSATFIPNGSNSLYPARNGSQKLTKAFHFKSSLYAALTSAPVRIGFLIVFIYSETSVCLSAHPIPFSSA